jgi:hypothetical protein
MTLNSVIKRIRDLCLAHNQIRSFDVGRVTDFLTDKTKKYPAVFVQDNGGAISTDGHAATLNYRIFFVDLVNASEDTKENELDVQSDMVSVAMDIIAQINSSNFSDWRISSENNLQLLEEEGDDLYAGCYIDCSIRIMFTQNICQVPSNINIVSAAGSGQSGSVVIRETVTRDIINPNAPLSSYNSLLPANPVDKQRHELFFGGTIAAGDLVVLALTVSAVVGQSIYQPLTPMEAFGGDVMAWEFEAATSYWRRVQ